MYDDNVIILKECKVILLEAAMPLSTTPVLSFWWRTCFSVEKFLRSAVCGAPF
jgi:hypothetical protein